MSVSVKKVVDDNPSRVCHEIRAQLNALLDAVDASTGYADLKSGILAACEKIVTTIEGPTPPQIQVP